jgi:hypothetical protein
VMRRGMTAGHCQGLGYEAAMITNMQFTSVAKINSLFWVTSR